MDRVTISALSAFPLFGAAVKTFVYVSNAQDGNIDAYTMDASTGLLAPIGKAETGKLVMPMAVSPDKKHLYAMVRSQPPRVLTYAIDPTNGALTQKASAPLPDSTHLQLAPG
jgi:6-phosphogluconolactonase